MMPMSNDERKQRINKKRAEFLEWVSSSGATTKHLKMILAKFPNHRDREHIVAELKRRATCQSNLKKANESTKKT